MVRYICLQKKGWSMFGYNFAAVNAWWISFGKMACTDSKQDRDWSSIFQADFGT